MAAGTAAMLLYAFVSYFRLMRKVRIAVKADDGVYETDLIPTAFSAGFFPPRIYLPCGLSKKERELIIAHEQVHIKRLDFIAKPLAFAGLAIHWFNPLIWAAFVLMTRDMELSCDEAVLKALGTEEKKEYSRALLRVSMKRSGLAALPLAFAGTGIRERVKNVLSYKKPRIIATVIAAAVVLTACAVLGTNGVRDSEAEDYDEASLTLIENDPIISAAANYQMIEIENRSGDRIILLNTNDRSYHENAGLNSALIGPEGQMMIFTGDMGSIDINIDPEYITKAVIDDLQIKHYDDYDGDGEMDDLTFVAIDMELQMTDDYVMPPIHDIVSGDKEHGTVMCGGNNQKFGIYAEIEIDRNELERAHDYCPGIMLDFRCGIKNDGRWMDDIEIYVTDDLKITNMSLERTIDEERRQAEEARKLEDEEFMRFREEAEQQSAELFLNDLPVLEYPVKGFGISETYGSKSLPNGAEEFHKGIDFSVSEGTPVYASADGKVISSRITANGYGNCIIIDHGSELLTLYAHLQERLVSEGDEVKAGDLIGYSGKTGYVVDDTLHFEVRVEGQHTDPMLFLKPETNSLPADQPSGKVVLERFAEIYADNNITDRFTEIYTDEERELYSDTVVNFSEDDPNFVYPIENLSGVNISSYPFDRSADRSVRKTVTFSPVPEGTPVYASADGIVEASEETKAGFGDMIKIGYNYGLSLTYYNLGKRLVNVGDKVKKGDLIAYSGVQYTSSAADFGQYLQVEVKLGGEYPIRIYNTLQNAGGGAGNFTPMFVYKGVFYVMDEEITDSDLAEKYLDGSLESMGEIQGHKFILEQEDELCSNFIPVTDINRLYKYEEDDSAIVSVYTLDGKHAAIFRPM